MSIGVTAAARECFAYGCENRVSIARFRDTNRDALRHRFDSFTVRNDGGSWRSGGS
jgi:hypothetical protein